AFTFDALGQLVTPDGGLVQGWGADAAGNVDVNGPLQGLRLPVATLMGASASTSATYEGNLPADAEVGTILNRQIDVYDGAGGTHALNLAFTRTATGWDISGTIAGTTSTQTGSITFTTEGAIDTLTFGAFPGDTAAGTQPITVDLSALTGFAGLETAAASAQDGRSAGTLQSFAINADGTLMGSFSNGLKQAIGRVALASFANPTGLEKSGSSLYAPTVNSGDAQVGAAGTGGRGSLAGGSLEMSNVDLSAEFTNLIVAQRGFQANSRVITTSDEVLQELVNLKR
ncbi:MAG: flagellar hook protein FlgE, partial [Demequina sp.]|uniref:flagellar hook protein FlgE n=1 Tax=Demequina sp. TaxID=2050685 RepID=UPI003A8B7729